MGNLSFDVTREELIEAFGAAGRVVDAKVPTDRETGRPRGFAFVEFESEDAARRCIEQLNGHDLKGRALRINEAENRPPRPAGAPPGGGFSRPGGGFLAPARLLASRRRLLAARRWLPDASRFPSARGDERGTGTPLPEEARSEAGAQDEPPAAARRHPGRRRLHRAIATAACS